MLVLTRKVHQEITIGDGITITILAIRGKQVRLGIKAPRHLSIRRDELLAKAAPGSAQTPEETGLKLFV
jgi:carbon storage regulator